MAMAMAAETRKSSRGSAGMPELTDPLDSPKILSKIMNFCQPPFLDLQNFRLVSRLWHEVTLDIWRNTAVLKLIPDIPHQLEPDTDDESPTTSTSASSPIYQSKDRTGVPMSEFLQNVVDPSDPYDLDTKPFSRVKLKGIDMEEEMEYSTAASNPYEIINVLPRVWDLIGAFVTYLHFEECTFESTFRMGAFQKLVLEKTPFLQTLVLTNSIVLAPRWEQNPHLIIRYDSNLHFTSLKVRGDFPMALACLLTYVPNITELKIRRGSKEYCQDRHYFSNIWVPFSCLRKCNKSHFKLTKLDVMHTDTFKISFNPTNQFRTTRLPLELLSVEISPFVDCCDAGPPVASSSKGASSSSSSSGGSGTRLQSSEDLITPMMREHRDSLQIFKVFRAPFSSSFSNFPFGVELGKLRELKIWGNITENLNFLTSTPNLQVLYINTTCFEKWEEMKDLLELEFPFEYQPFREDIVKFTGNFHRNFSVEMMQLTELHIELWLEPDSICKLADWMPNLKAFRCIFYKLTFRCVCATMPGLEELGILFGSEVDNETLTGLTAGVARNPDNVTSLKFLKRFQMDCYCGQSGLKDSAVYLGFLKMPTLQRVQACVSRQMSDRAEQELKTSVPGQVIFIRNYGSKPHVGYDCCKRTRFAREVIGRIPQTASDIGGGGNNGSGCSAGGQLLRL